MWNQGMLLLARELRQLTQTELSKKSDIAQPLLSQYEKGAIIPTLKTQQKISVALSFPLEFFQLNAELLTVKESQVTHRKRKALIKREMLNAQARANLLLIQLKRSLNKLNFKPIQFPSFPLASIKMEIEEVANRVNSILSLHDKHASNLASAFESAGGFVLKIDFLSDLLDGFIIRDRTTAPVVFLNKRVPGDRMRFSLAHEIGHIVMHEWPTEDPENEANAFAAALLMPLDQILADLQVPITLHTLMDLKIKWRVSLQALIMRASQLHCISNDEKTRLFKQLSAKRWRKQEPIEIPQEEARHFQYIMKSLNERLHESTVKDTLLICDPPSLDELNQHLVSEYGLSLSVDRDSNNLSVL